MNRVEIEKASEEIDDWEERAWKRRNFDDGQFKYEVFKREGFSIKDIIKKKGVAVEVAGPTDNGFWFHDFSDKSKEITSFNLAEGKKFLTSNLYPGVPEFSREGFKGYYGKVDFIADAREMPVKKGGADLVYCSCLGSIAKSGVKIIVGARPEDVPVVEKEGLASEFSFDMAIENIVAENHKLREQVIEESWNILKPGGILVWQGGWVHDVGFAIGRGFVLLQREQESDKRSDEVEPTQNIIFLKPEVK